MNIKKKLLIVTLVMGINISSLSTTISAGDYDSVSTPSIVTTSYLDALNNVAREDAKKAEKESGGSSSSSSDSNSSGDGDAKANLQANVQKILSVGNFGSVGLLYGPSSAVGSDNYSQLQNPMSLDHAGISNLDKSQGGNGKAEAYYQFGRGISTLQNESYGRDPSAITIEQSADNFTDVATAFAESGIKIVKNYNPAPVLLSFYDSSYLNDNRFAGEDGNEFVKIINDYDMLRTAVRYMGDPFIGGVSRSFAFTFIIAFVLWLLAFFTKIWNGKGLGYSTRRLFLRVAIAGAIFPASAFAFSHGVNMIADGLVDTNETAESKILSQNLNILDWYQNAAFGLPSGMQITVRNGTFEFTPSQVLAINRYSMKNHVSTNAENLVGKLGEDANKVTNSEDKQLVNRMLSIASSNNNMSPIRFQPTYGQSGSQTMFGGSTPWDTGKIIKVADALGKNKKIPDDLDLNSIEYFTAGKLEATGGNGVYTYSMNGSGYGLSPISAFNLMGTTFTNNGFSVTSNIEQIKSVSVGMDVVKAGTGKDDGKNTTKANSIIKFICLLYILYAGIKALMDILIAGFSGVFKGGLGGALGYSAGIGQIIGALLVLVFGIMGLSLITLVAIKMIDVAWAFVDGMISGKNDEDGAIIKPLYEGISKSGFLGSILAKLVTSVAEFIMSLCAIFFIPKIVTAPINAYATFLAGIPNQIAERARRFEQRFLSSYGSGGGMAGNSNVTKASDHIKNNAGDIFNRAAAIGAGAGMIGGALISKIGGALSGETVADAADIENKNTSNNETDLKNNINGKEITEGNFEETKEGNEFQESSEIIENPSGQTNTPKDGNLKSTKEPITGEKNVQQGKVSTKQPISNIENKQQKHETNGGQINDEKTVNLDNNKNAIKQDNNEETIAKQNQENAINSKQHSEVQGPKVHNPNEEFNLNEQKVNDKFNDNSKFQNEEKIAQNDSVANALNEEQKNQQLLRNQLNNNSENNLTGKNYNNTPISEEINNQTGNTSVNGNNSQMSQKPIDGKITETPINTTSNIIGNGSENQKTKTDDKNNVNKKENKKSLSARMKDSAKNTTLKPINSTKGIVKNNTGTRVNNRGKEMHAMRLNAGRKLQKIGGYASGDKQGRKQIAAGLTHMAGGLLGAQKYTGKIANRVNNARNDRYMQHVNKPNEDLSEKQSKNKKKQFKQKPIRKPLTGKTSETFKTNKNKEKFNQKKKTRNN